MNKKRLDALERKLADLQRQKDEQVLEEMLEREFIDYKTSMITD